MDQAQCEAILWHGPGHQSRTRCEIRGQHETHRCVYGETHQEATWRDGQYIEVLREGGHLVPEYVNEGTMMTGFFDEPPEG